MFFGGSEPIFWSAPGLGEGVRRVARAGETSQEIRLPSLIVDLSNLLSYV